MKTCAREGCTSKVKNNRNTYCSSSCASLATRKRGRTPRPKECRRDGCLEVFDADSPSRKYCSRSCAAIVNNRARRKSPQTCLAQDCTQSVDYAAKFCSQDCSTEYRWKEKLRIAKETDAIPTSPPACKALIRLDRGWYCEIPECGITHWLDREAPLILDHIDGHADNHVWSNIRLVCPMCDAFLPTYKSKNRGNGRHSRRERYKNGKSY